MIEQNRFQKGIVSDQPKDKLPVGAVRTMLNMTVDDDGGLIALPWLIPVTQTLASIGGSFDGAYFQMVKGIVDSNGTEYPKDYWASEPATLGVGRTTQNLTTCEFVDASATFTSGGYAFYPLGTGQVIQSYDLANGTIDYYFPMWGEWTNAAASGVPNSFVIKRMRWTGTGAPTLGTHTGTTTPVTGATVYTSGSKFPLFTAIYCGQMWVAGDYSTAGLMRNRVYASATPSAAGSHDFSTINTSGNGWGGNYVNLDVLDAVTGLKSTSDGLYIFTTSNVKVVRGSTAELQTGVTLMQGSGCPAPNSIVQYEDSFYFLSERGFVRMAPDGSYEQLSNDSNVRSMTLDMISMQPRNGHGVFTNMGGSACIHNGRYWYVWPTGQVWCYNIEYDAWSFHDGVFYTDTDLTQAVRPSAIVGGLDEWPCLIGVNASGGNIYKYAESHIRDLFADQYSPASAGYATDLLPYVELPTVPSQLPEKLARIVIDCEPAWLNRSTASGYCTLGIELLNESSDTLYRGIAVIGVYQMRQQRIICELKDAIPADSFTLKMFACVNVTSMDRVSYNSQATRCAHLKILNVQYIGTDDDVPSMQDADRTAITAITGTSELYTNVSVYRDAFRWPSYSVPQPDDVSRYWTRISVTGAANMFTHDASTPFKASLDGTGTGLYYLNNPDLYGYNYYEAYYSIITAVADQAFGLALCTGLATASADSSKNYVVPSITNVTPNIPIAVDMRVSGGNLVMRVSYYDGTADGGTMSVTIGAANAAVHGIRIYHVPNTNVFMVDHTTIGTQTFPTDPTTERVLVHAACRVGEAPLRPAFGLRAPSATTDAYMYSIKAHRSQTIVT